MDEVKEMVNSSNKWELMKDEEGKPLPGFRFHPTDEELVGFYLKKKVEQKQSIELIKQIDIYKYDPWDLPKIGGDKEWYFYCLRGRKYKNSIRPNRVTGHGFWKATGIDRPIYSQSGQFRANELCIGLKKSLVYYRGSAGKGTKTDWMMHEFRLPTDHTNFTAKNSIITSTPHSKNTQEAEVWTICRIFKRTMSYKKYAPDLTDSSLFKIKRNPIPDSTSCITYSSDKSNTKHEQCSQFQGVSNNNYSGESHAAQQYVEVQRSPSLPVQFSSVSSLANSYYTGFPNSSTEVAGSFQRNENWDELAALVEFALHDPNSTLNEYCSY